jgi:hypothetical protein
LNSAGALALVLAGPGRGPGMQKQVLLRTTTSEASSLSLARSWSPAPRGRCGCRGRSEGQLGWGLNGHFCRAEPPVDPPRFGGLPVSGTEIYGEGRRTHRSQSHSPGRHQSGRLGGF